MRRKRQWKRADGFAAWLAMRAGGKRAGYELRALVDVLAGEHASTLDAQLTVYLRECGMTLHHPRERLERHETEKARNSRIMHGRLERNRVVAEMPLELKKPSPFD